MLRIKELISDLLAIAGDAGKKILEIYNSSNFDVQLKSDNSPLTKADIASNEIIINGLKKLDLGFPILSEESREVPFG